MSKTYKKIGEDFDLTVNVDDSAGANKALNSSEGYAVFLYYNDGTVIHKYSKNAVTGYDSTNIDTSDEANGNITCRVLREFSDGTTYTERPDQDVYVEVLTQDTDADFTNSQFRSIGSVYGWTWSTSVSSPTVDVS
jgi:hypothetical protein